MLKKVITYEDYDGNERQGTYYFNFNKNELVEMNFSLEGGLENHLKKIIQTQDMSKLYQLVKDLVVKSYGEKSADGNRFIKRPEIKEAFVETAAFDELMMSLMDPDELSKFINGIMPQKLVAGITQEQIDAQTKKLME